MKAGAHDYLMKGNLTRLVPAIERELHEAEVRKERKLVQEELRVAEQNFRNSIDNSPLGIRIVTAEGETIYANQAILDIYGYSSVEELKATPSKKRYTPESYAEHQERKERRKLGKPGPPNYETSIVRKDGEIRHLVLSRKEVVWDGEVQYQVIHQDITERKQAEEERNKFFDLSLNLLLIAGLDGYIKRINPGWTEALGHTVEELIGTSFFELVHPDDRAATLAEMEKLSAGIVTLYFENRYRCKDGSYRLLAWAAVPHPETGLVYAIAQDITERKQAEETVRESEEKYRQLFELGSDALFLIEVKTGKILDLNNAAIEMYGYSREEALQMKNTDFSAEPDKTREATLESEKHVPVRYHRRKDGTIFPTDISVAYYTWYEKEVCVAAIRDITERKQAEEALRDSEEHFRALIENSSDIIQIVDSEGVIRYVSPSVQQVLGYKPEELIGRPSVDVVHPDDLPIVAKGFEKAIQEPGVPVIVECRCKHKDGTWHIIEGIGMNHLDDPYLNGFVSNMHDITERKQAEEGIKRAAEEWRTTFDSITDFVSIHDKDFKIVRVNKAFADILKMKPKELIGKTCYKIVHGTNEPVPSCPHMKTLETKKAAIEEFFEPHLGIYLEVATSPIFNEKGEVVVSVHVARDITERKKMEEQLIVTDRLASIGELSSGIAHELNNPLTGVIGFSDLLLGKDVPDDIKEDLEVINKEAKRTAEVVKNLLTFARKREPEKQPVDVNNIMKTVLKLRAYEQRVNNIQVNTQFAPDLPEITADGFQLQQVFLNIIINAEHFMTEARGRGTITITTERVGNIIRASLADDGPGIAKEKMGHIFDPFFTTKEVGKGTGLGLSICHGIITEHGGRVYAESKLGKGATFVVELPISK